MSAATDGERGAEPAAIERYARLAGLAGGVIALAVAADYLRAGGGVPVVWLAALLAQALAAVALWRPPHRRVLRAAAMGNATFFFLGTVVLAAVLLRPDEMGVRPGSGPRHAALALLLALTVVSSLGVIARARGLGPPGGRAGAGGEAGGDER